MMIAVAAFAALLIAMFLALLRTYAGPTVYDRILAVNLFGTKTVLLIALAAYLSGTPDYLDVALVYALINFASVIGALQFFEQSRETSG